MYTWPPITNALASPSTVQIPPVRARFEIKELTANGDWYALLEQEITRLGGLERQRGNWAWRLAYVYAVLGVLCALFQAPS